MAEGLALCRTPAKASRVTQPVALQLRQVELLVLGEMVLLVVEVDISGIRNQLMHLQLLDYEFILNNYFCK